MPVTVKVMVDPTQTLEAPDNVGDASMLIVFVTLQPPELVKVIVVDPVDIPVTNPELVTVATPGDDETQAFELAGVPDPVSWIVVPAHIDGLFPPDDVIVGWGKTVNKTELLHPELLLLYPIIVVPGP